MQHRTMRRRVTAGPNTAAAIATAMLAALPAGIATPARADAYQLIVYTPLSVNEVDASAGCPDVAASGKRIRAECAPEGELVFSVHVPQVENGAIDCLVTLRDGGPDGERFVGIEAASYDSDDLYRRCSDNIAVRPGERYRERQHMHVTKSGW